MSPRVGVYTLPFMKVTVIVTPKASILDPQGEAVRKAIHNLGVESVSSTRIGKHIELEVDGSDEDTVRRELEPIARELLSNPVIEDYRIEINH